MRKIKNNVFMVLALLPLLTFLLMIFRNGTSPNFLQVLTDTFGDFGMFFRPILTPVLTDFVQLTDEAGVALFTWLIGYYITLLFVYIIYNLFTLLITICMDKIDNIKGGFRK